MPEPIREQPRLAWSIPDVRRVLGGRAVVLKVERRAQLVSPADAAPLGKPVSGSDDADWALTADDVVVRLDDGVLALIDPASGKPRHQIKTPGARRLVVAGGRLFAHGKPQIHCIAVHGDAAPVLAWSAPCDLVRAIFVLGERVVIADVKGGKGRTRQLALDGGAELATLPGIAMLADERGLVLDAGTAFVVTDPAGATRWRASFKQLRPDALLRDHVVANQTRADLLAGPEVILDRATGKLRATIPEAGPESRLAADAPTQKIVAVADDTIYIAEGITGRAQPVQAFDADARLRWTFDVTLGGGHHINVLDAGDRRILGWTGSGRAFCLVEGTATAG